MDACVTRTAVEARPPLVESRRVTRRQMRGRPIPASMSSAPQLRFGFVATSR